MLCILLLNIWLFISIFSLELIDLYVCLPLSSHIFVGLWFRFDFRLGNLCFPVVNECVGGFLSNLDLKLCPLLHGDFLSS